MKYFRSKTTLTRRSLLRLSGVGTLSGTVLTQPSLVTGKQSQASSEVNLEQQTSDGNSIVIKSVSTSVDAQLLILEEASGEEESYHRMTLSAGTSKENLTIELSKPIPKSKKIKAVLISKDELLARDTAYIYIGKDTDNIDLYGVSFVEADPDSGFHYPYFLFTPPEGDRENVPILVEPNNTGTSTDDFQQHRQEARERIEDGLSRRISTELSVPLLIPVFPRPRHKPVDGTHYTHQLDRDTLAISEGPLKRIDLQLLRMVDHAKQRLSETDYTFSDQVMLNGFSASGNFVDRFTVLHADRVLSVTAGGLNGMTLLPLKETQGHTLRYQIGIADVEELTGESVNLDALNEVNQLLYMGSEDNNDTLPYSDAWTSDELRQTAKEVYGENMIEERFPVCATAYEQAGVEAQFKIYEGAGHTPRPAVDDIIEFHKRSLDGDSVDEFGEQLGTEAKFAVSANEDGSKTSVTFDASQSQANPSDIIAYTWKLGDGETAAGQTVTHEYEETGEFTVTLRVINSGGGTDTITRTVTVETNAVEVQSTTEDKTSTNAGLPGFGVGTTLSALGGAGATYLLRGQLTEDTTTMEETDE